MRMLAGTAVSTSGWPNHRLSLIHRSHHGLQSPHDKYLVSPGMIPQYHAVHTQIFSNYLKNSLRAFIPEQIKSRFMHGKWLLYLLSRTVLPPSPRYLLCKEPRTDEFRMSHTLDLCDCFLLMAQVNDP